MLKDPLAIGHLALSTGNKLDISSSEVTLQVKLTNGLKLLQQKNRASRTISKVTRD